ncbi:MAG: hypothetical protein WBK32_01685 [Candidatus Saccharicenans sp.]|jgi:hypothetical protein|nr:hypothetical protein [Candidatus Saccharicenans sp.]
MNKENQKLKNLFTAQGKPEEKASRVDCPAPEELARFFDARASLGLKAKIVNHLIDCPACRQEFELLRLGEKLVAEINNKLLKPKKPFRMKLRLFFSSPSFLKQAAGALTSLMIIFCLFYFLNISERKSQQVERNLREAQNLVMFEEIVDSTPLKINLSWQPLEEALFYQVEVFNQNMYLVWQSPPTTETRISLPEEITSDLKNGSHFFWQILIYCPGEKTIDSAVRKMKFSH